MLFYYYYYQILLKFIAFKIIWDHRIITNADVEILLLTKS